MNLRELFDHLAFSELSQLVGIDSNTGLVEEKAYDKVLSAINLGLTALHSRFLIKEEELKLQLLEGISTYKLTATDLLKVESVCGSNGYEYPLNDHSRIDSVFTPNLNTIKVPPSMGVDLLTITYRGNHRILPMGLSGYSADLVDIDLPITYVEPLLYFVGSRLHNPMGLVNDFNAGNNYAAKYERACAEIERSNIRVDQDSQNSRFTANGWV